MPAPLAAVAPVVAGAGKLGALGAMGAKLKGALGALFGAKKAAAGAAATTGKKGILRMAGDALFGDMGKTEMALRFGPDILVGTVAGLQTPGDLGDKLIAGTTSAAGGSLGGLIPGRISDKLGLPGWVGTMTDMAGSYGGDMIGMNIGDNLQRGKDSLLGGEGLTAWERLSKDQQEEFADTIRQDTLASLGLLPGIRSEYFN